MRKTYLCANLFWLALAILLGALSLVSLVQDLREMSGPASELWGGVRWVRWAVMVAALFIYVAVLEWLGFMAATFLLMLVLFRLLEPYRWTTVLLFSLFTMASAYVFFVVLLDGRLPVGVLGF